MLAIKKKIILWNSHLAKVTAEYSDFDSQDGNSCNLLWTVLTVNKSWI